MNGRSTNVPCTVSFFIHICISEIFIIPFKKKGQKGGEGSYNYNIVHSSQGGNSFENKAKK